MNEAEFNDESNRIYDLPNGFYFKYYIADGPFDFWQRTLSPEQLIDNYKNDYYNKYGQSECYRRSIKEVKEITEQIRGFVYSSDKEYPHTIAFTSIPTTCGFEFELVGLAKIENNGTSYIFCNDLDYMKYLEKKFDNYYI